MASSSAHINRIATAVPDHDVHRKFVAFAPTLLRDERSRLLFRRMAERSQIEHRYSCIPPDPDPGKLDGSGFYEPGRFPDTRARMRLYEEQALPLARLAVERLALDGRAETITHLIVVSCTGFYAPGLDLQLVEHLGLSESVERTVVGFMGCYAALNALKLARHIVRSEPQARVLLVNLELCTLHLQETGDLEQVLSFLIFGDGCAASLISAEPTGVRLDRFRSTILPDSAEQITWRVGELGFEMMLSGKVPQTLARSLEATVGTALGNIPREHIAHWAIHPGGRSVLDAVADTLQFRDGELLHSREVLRRYGNMSSASVMFVLQNMLAGEKPGRGCAMAFGPGITAESMLFEIAA